MSFHRNVMRNHARQVAGNRGLSRVWPMVRRARWVARGSRAVVWTARHKCRPKVSPLAEVAARPGLREQRGVRAVLHRLMHGMVRQTHGAARGR